MHCEWVMRQMTSGFSSSIMSILVLLHFKGHQECVLQKWAGYENSYHPSLCHAKVKNVWLCSAALLYVLITRQVKAQQQLFTFYFCLLTFAFLLHVLINIVLSGKNINGMRMSETYMGHMYQHYLDTLSNN